MTKMKVGLRSMLRSQGGQGTVEYLLLLVVVIALAGALMARFFKPFDSWAKNYLGEYFYCLLDEGELPALGGPNGSGDCNESFEEFSVAGGRPEKEDGGSGEDSAEADALKKRQRSRANADGGGGGGGGSASRRRPTFLNNRTSGTDGARGDGGTSIAQPEKSGGFMNLRKPTIIYVGGKSERARGFAGLLISEREKAKKREEKVTLRRTGSEEGGGTRARKPAVTSSKIARKDREIEITGYDFSLGGAVRMAFIIGIVLVLIFLIASQLNSISKSLEK